MDEVFRISKRLWIHQEPITIRSFITSCQQTLDSVGGTNESVKTVEAFESSLRYLSHSSRSQSVDDMLDAACQVNQLHAKSQVPKGSSIASSIKSKEEAVLSIRFLKTKVGLSKINRANLKIVPEYEVEVLSSQLLSDLRSVIRCENSASCQYSSDEKVVREESGFFFIENTFYNDTGPESSDYSSIIMQWAKSQATGISEMKSVPLENVKFKDLTLRLGYPYLYRHMGDCEHLLVFQWLRMWNPLIDHNTYSSYPRISWTKSKLQEKCAFCSVNAAKSKVKAHPHLPSSCVLLCQECLQLFCQDKEAAEEATIEAYFDQSILFSKQRLCSEETFFIPKQK